MPKTSDEKLIKAAIEDDTDAKETLIARNLHFFCIFCKIYLTYITVCGILKI